MGVFHKHRVAQLHQCGFGPDNWKKRRLLVRLQPGSARVRWLKDRINSFDFALFT